MTSQSDSADKPVSSSMAMLTNIEWESNTMILSSLLRMLGNQIHALQSCICNHTHQDTIKLLQCFPMAQEGVGDIFIIVEPDMVKYYLGDTSSVPIIECPKKFIPINNRSTDIIPKAKLDMPDAYHTPDTSAYTNRP